MDSSYTLLWMIWGLFFLAIEGAALFKKDNGTLSAHIWKFLGLKGYTIPKGYKWRRGALGVFLLWLVAHLFGAV